MAILTNFIATKSETLILKSENDQNQPKMQIFLYFGLNHFILNVLRITFACSAYIFEK